jgi:Fe-S cluster assembly protein SufD
MAAEFITKQLELAKSISPLTWLGAINERGQQAFAEATIPTRKTEAWKYTSLYNLTETGFANAAPAAQAHADVIPGLQALRIVVANGEVDTAASDAAALEMVVRFRDARPEQQEAIRALLGEVKADRGHLFADLNDASINDGLFVLVEKNQRLEHPLHIFYANTSGHEAFTVNTRLLIALEQGAEATVIEHYAGEDTEAGKQNNFTNAVTEIRVGDNAKLVHYRLQLMAESAFHIGGTFIDLQRDARYEGFHLGMGTALTRNDVIVNHNVGGSHCQMNGVYVPQNQQVVDFHTCVEHKVAHCTTDEVFRGIMNDKAKAIFNGRIHIHPDAQKTLAELSNKNLLLTNTAEINTKPELEIYADDVQCAHGATVAQLEEKARFYLQSRGISAAEAEVMLSFGFINELLNDLNDEAVGLWLRPQLAKRFGREDTLSAQLTGEL